MIQPLGGELLQFRGGKRNDYCFSEGLGERMLRKLYTVRWLEKWQEKDKVPKVQAGNIKIG